MARLISLAPGLAALLVPQSAAAQGRLQSAVMHVDSRAGPETIVRIEAVLSPNGATVVPVAAVRFDGDSPLNPAFNIDGNPVAGVPAAAARAGRPAWDVPIPEVLRSSERIRLVVDYRVVAGDMATRIRLPVVAVLWPPASAAAGTFRAEVRLPAGVTAFDAFPSTFRITGDTLITTLHVLPALVSFHMASARPWASAAIGVELGVLALLIVISWIGWRRFRAEMR